MLVKKKNPEWYPSENKNLRVGETIEITDPKALIINNDVVAIDKEGIEISAYDLYGVIVKDERKEFEEYLKLRKAQALEKELKRQQEELKAQIKETEGPKDAPAPAPTEAPAQETAWGDLVKEGKALGVFKVGMKRPELVAAIAAKK